MEFHFLQHLQLQIVALLKLWICWSFVVVLVAYGAIFVMFTSAPVLTSEYCLNNRIFVSPLVKMWPVHFLMSAIIGLRWVNKRQRELLRQSSTSMSLFGCTVFIPDIMCTERTSLGTSPPSPPTIFYFFCGGKSSKDLPGQSNCLIGFYAMMDRWHSLYDLCSYRPRLLGDDAFSTYPLLSSVSHCAPVL